jgi:hypothetical protein
MNFLVGLIQASESKGHGCMRALPLHCAFSQKDNKEISPEKDRTHNKKYLQNLFDTWQHNILETREQNTPQYAQSFSQNIHNAPFASSTQ